MDAKDERALRIGDVARLTGTTPDALRFWEKEGLIPKAARRPSGYREFPEGTVERVRFLQRSKRLGFSLEEIRGLAALQDACDSSSQPVREAVLAKIRDLDKHIASLQALRSQLQGLADTCDGLHPIEECPILDHLSHCQGDCAHGLDATA